MSTKPTKKAVKKAAATTPKSAKQLARPAAPAKRKLAAATEAALPSSAAANSEEMLRKLAQQKSPLTEEQKRQQTAAFMGKVLGDVSRLDNQVKFLHDESHRHFSELGDQIIYLDQCIGMLFDHLHLPRPKRQPRLINADVTLALPEEIPAEEAGQWEMKAAYHETAHPIFGNYEIIFGEGADATTMALAKLQPILRERLIEAFDARRAAGELVNGTYYVVKTILYHASPVSDESVLVQHDAG